MIRTVQFFAILLPALSLVPAGAHLMEISATLGMPGPDYLTVQRLSQGWALAGAFLVGALAVDVLLAFMSRAQAGPCYWIIAAAVLMLFTQVTFFIVVYPVNQATENWTRLPDNWQDLRSRWEFMHAGNAVVTLMALVATIIGSLTWRG